MKKAKKILALVLCVLLLIGATIAGTVAYMTSKDHTVTNTFSVGNVTITMDEADVNEYGQLLYKTGETDSEGKAVLSTTVTGNIADRVMANSYKLIPAASYKKDPIVHVQAGSEPCWVFVVVNNGIANFESGATDATYKKIATQLTDNGWSGLKEGIYYKENVDARSEQQNLKVFEGFTIAEGAENVTGWGEATVTVTVTAHAIQAEGLTTAQAAATALGLITTP